MATRRWVNSAVGVYRQLLAEQQAGGAAGAAGLRLWQAELCLALPAVPGSAASGNLCAAKLHTAATLRLWLPAGSALSPHHQQQQQMGLALLHTSALAMQSPHRGSVKSQVTQPAPLAGTPPGGELPHQSLTPHRQPASAAAVYEAADAGGWQQRWSQAVPAGSRQPLPAQATCQVMCTVCIQCVSVCPLICHADLAAEECDEVMEEYTEARRQARWELRGVVDWQIH